MGYCGAYMLVDVSLCAAQWMAAVKFVCGIDGKEPRPVPASPWDVQTEGGSSWALVVGGCEWGCSDGGERKGNPALSTAHWV